VAHLTYFARSLLRHDDAESAQGWLKELEKRQPSAYGTLEIKARVLASQGQGKQAAALLQAYARNHEDRLAAVAQLLEQVGQTAAAKEMYEQYVAKAKLPESVLLLAQFLGRQGELTKALDLCEQAAAKCASDKVAAVSLNLLYQGVVKDEDCRRVARWLESEIRKDPQKASLLNFQAALYNLQGNLPEAEAAHRQVLKLNERDATALNNLAWLLAFQPAKAEEALDLVQRAITIAGPQNVLVDTRSVIHLMTGHADLAVKDLEGVLAEAPSGTGFFHLAQAHHKGKNRLAATAAMQQASRHGLKESELHPLERAAYRQLCSDLDVAKQ
jgi:tetratricopeptide (TPR) repeat protein